MQFFRDLQIEIQHTNTFFRTTLLDRQAKEQEEEAYARQAKEQEEEAYAAATTS